MGTIEEVQQAVNEANRLQNAVDANSLGMAKLLVGRLGSISRKWGGHETLCALKRELSNYNATTGEWK